MTLILKPIVALTPLLVLAIWLAGGSVAAATPGTSSGSFTFTSSVVTDSRAAGPNTILTNTNTYSVTGTFSGTLVCHETQIVKGSGASTFHDTCDFTGSVDGHSGTAVVRLSGSSDADLSSRGHSVSIGTGALEGLHEESAFVGNPDGSGTYLGHLRFRS